MGTTRNPLPHHFFSAATGGERYERRGKIWGADVIQREMGLEGMNQRDDVRQWLVDDLEETREH